MFDRQIGGNQRFASPARTFFFTQNQNLPPPVPEIPHEVVIQAASFWQQYVNNLEHQQWNSVAIAELENKVDEILATVSIEEDGRMNRTSIIGEVQSGKTASMIGLAAKGLDLGFKLVIVLAGHQNDLRNQSSKRFNRDLLGLSEKIGQESTWSIDRTAPGISGIRSGLVDDEDYTWTWIGQQRAYGLPSHCDLTQCVPLARGMLEKVLDGEQAIFVIKKQTHAMDHLMNLITDVLRRNPEQYPIMVIDDESDYATMPEPRLSNRRVWKPMIRRNWNLLIGYQGDECIPPVPTLSLPSGGFFNVYAFEYTATPQLPHRQPEVIVGMGPNPFYSRNHVVLRSASDRESSVEYDSSLDRYGEFSWYTGPSMFYGQYWNQRPPLYDEDELQHPSPDLNDQNYSNPQGVVFELTDTQLNPDSNPRRFECGLISYFVAGAIRFAQQDTIVGGSEDKLIFSLDPDSNNPWPKTHSALIHCDHLRDSHWQQVGEVMRLFGDDRVIDRTRATHYVNPARFENWINDRHQILINWYDYFKEKHDQVVEDGAIRPDFPSWPHVEKVFYHWSNHVKIKVINSDPNPKTPLDFDSRSDSEGNIIAPKDVYTIVIGGNSLARGLTIEGLCTTIFGRLANVPNQATMMQHQRWCGYRAHFWEYVTLHIGHQENQFMSNWSRSDQIDRWSKANKKLGVLRLTTRNIDGRPIRGATKITTPFSLGLVGDYQFRHVELLNAEKNERVMFGFIEKVLESPQVVADAHIVNTTNQLSALEVADMLDELEYTFTGDNWSNSQPEFGGREATTFQALSNWFKNQQNRNISFLSSGSNDRHSSLPLTQNPKLIAAYLRLWDALYHHGTELVDELLEGGLIQEDISPPPTFNLVFQGGDQNVSPPDEPMHPIFTDERLTDLVANPIRKASFRSNRYIVNQMRTGNRRDLPGGNRYVDLHLGNRNHPEWISGRFSGFRYTRQYGEPGVIIGQVFERAHLYDQNNRYGVPPVDCDSDHIPVSFMIDIPLGGPNFIIT